VSSPVVLFRTITNKFNNLIEEHDQFKLEIENQLQTVHCTIFAYDLQELNNG
jgi:hypothetical protein